jgi:hypothetical protein
MTCHALPCFLRERGMPVGMRENLLEILSLEKRVRERPCMMRQGLFVADLGMTALAY